MVKALRGVNGDLHKNIKFLGKTKFTSAYLNYNAEILCARTKEDTTITLVRVPLQQWFLPGKTSPASFNFSVGGRDLPSEHAVKVPLVAGMSIFSIVSSQHIASNTKIKAIL